MKTQENVPMTKVATSLLGSRRIHPGPAGHALQKPGGMMYSLAGNVPRCEIFRQFLIETSRSEICAKVCIVDLGERFHINTKYLLANIGFDTTEKEPSPP